MSLWLFFNDRCSLEITDWWFDLCYNHIIQINDRKTEEMSLREAIDTVRRSNRLDLLVIKDDNLPPSYSTHSLPAAFRHKSGGRERDMPNGYSEEEPEIPARYGI